MMKRVTWFVGGVAAGAVGVGAAKKKAKAVANDLAPVQIAKRATGSVTERGHRVADAVREGKRAMRTKEMELRARLDGSRHHAGRRAGRRRHRAGRRPTGARPAR